MAIAATWMAPSALTEYVAFGIEMPDRVVGDGGQVHDGVESFEFSRRDISDVARRRTLQVAHGPKVAPLVPSRVEPEHFVTMVTKKGTSTAPMYPRSPVTSTRFGIRQSYSRSWKKWADQGLCNQFDTNIFRFGCNAGPCEGPKV